MIKGVGIDIASVGEIRSLIEDLEGYVDEVFTPTEVQACSSRPNAYECFAARLAAKEAFMKAAGTGWSSVMEFLDITVHSDGASIPTITLSERATQQCERLGRFRISLSLSHTAEYACAVVLLDE